MLVGAKCQEAAERQGNVLEWVQSARGMQGNARECMGVGAKCQRNAGE